MIGQKVVAHYLDGRIHKGMTNNFFPDRPSFHILLNDSGERVEVNVDDLKGLFFVKDLVGDSEYQERKDIERRGYGRRIEVQFVDNETIVGHTQGYSPERRGFFVAPADPESNNERVFVVQSATTAVELR